MQLNRKKMGWAMISLNPFLFVPIYNKMKNFSRKEVHR